MFDPCICDICGCESDWLEKCQYCGDWYCEYCGIEDKECCDNCKEKLN